MNRKISLASRDPLPLGKEDVYKAMEEIGAYLDVTPRDFQEIYAHAYKIARSRLLSSVTAGGIMRVPVLCVTEGQAVRELIAFLDDHRISGAPVVGADGRISGVVSESDVVRHVGGGDTVTAMHLLHTLMRQGCIGGADLEAPVGAIMTRGSVTVGAETPLADMLELLRTRRINRIPVVDAGMRPVGIVSRTDIINAFGVVQ